MGAPTILVIDDEPSVQDLLRGALEPHGYTVETAANGAAGLARMEGEGIDLVLLDLMLPQVSGLEVCRQWRAREANGYLPIIMLTASLSEMKRRAGFAAGADDYVTKPFDVNELLDRVHVWLHTRQRLKVAHESLLHEQERLRQLEQRALRAQLAQDEAILTMARTASHELNQPLTALLGQLELRKAGWYGPEPPEQLWDALEQAAKELAHRVEQLTHAMHYETRDVFGYRLVDLERARGPRA